jgi:hypothetical protein
MISEIGHLLSPAIFALLADQASYAALFFFLALCSSAAAAVVGFQVRETVGREKL